MNNQDYALARWREDASKDDPARFTEAVIHGIRHVWLRLRGGEGWFAVGDGFCVPQGYPAPPWVPLGDTYNFIRYVPDAMCERLGIEREAKK